MATPTVTQQTDKEKKMELAAAKKALGEAMEAAQQLEIEKQAELATVKLKYEHQLAAAKQEAEHAKKQLELQLAEAMKKHVSGGEAATVATVH